MDRRGFLGIMVFATVGWLAGRGLVRRLGRTEEPAGAGLREAMHYSRVSGADRADPLHAGLYDRRGEQ